MQVAHKSVLSKVYGSGRGSIFTPLHFIGLGTRKAIDLALARLVQKKLLHHLTRGVYYYPKTHRDLGTLSPDPDKVARAIAGKSGTALQPTGAYAANLLGLSTQVPAKIVYLTDGRAKTVRIGKQQIQLRHTTPRNMATAGRVSGLVIQAFRHLGKEHIDQRMIAHLRKLIKGKDKKQLLMDARYAPAWIADHLRAITRDY